MQNGHRVFDQVQDSNHVQCKDTKIAIFMQKFQNHIKCIFFKISKYEYTYFIRVILAYGLKITKEAS